MKKIYVAIFLGLLVVCIIILTTPQNGLLIDGKYVKEAYYTLGEEATYVYESIGEKKTVLKATVTKLRLVDFLLYESDHYIEAYKPENKYFVVDIVVSNIGEKEEYMPTVKLRANGAIYTPTVEIPFTLSLSPMQTVKYSVLFDVPEDISSGRVEVIFDVYKEIRGYWTFTDFDKEFHKLKFKVGEGVTFGTEKTKYYLKIEDVLDLFVIGEGNGTNVLHLYRPESGYKFVAVKVYARNDGQSEVYVPYYSDFRLVSGGREYTPVYFGLKDSYIGGTLEYGHYTSGYVYFEVPVDATNYKIMVFLVPSQTVRGEWTV